MLNLIKSKSNIIFFLILFVGVSFRVIAFYSPGTHDVNSFINWGILISDQGWPKGYQGIYFPSSYLLLEQIVNISNLFSTNIQVSYFILRIIFELFFMIALIYLYISKKLDLSLFSLIWLNPYLIILNFEGYTDIFMSSIFLIILIILIKINLKNMYVLALISGLLISFFAYLKPQTLIYTLFIFFFISLFVKFKKKNIYLLLLILWTISFVSITIIYSNLLASPTFSCQDGSEPRVIAKLSPSGETTEVKWNVCIDENNYAFEYPLTGPVICLERAAQAYSPFGEGGSCLKEYDYTNSDIESPKISSGLNTLISQLYGTSDVLPSYSANMPNVWYSYATLIKQAQEPIYEAYVSKTKNQLIWIFGAILLLLLAIFTRYSTHQEVTPETIFLQGAFIVSFFIPFFLTLAHENHAALGILSGILILTVYEKRMLDKRLVKSFKILILVLSILLALNVYQRYTSALIGKFNNDNFQFDAISKIYEIPNILTIYQIGHLSSLVSVGIFCIFISDNWMQIFKNKSQ